VESAFAAQLVRADAGIHDAVRRVDL